MKTSRAELIKQLREARAMLRIVGFDDECDDGFKRSWRRSLKRIDAALKNAP